LKIVKSLERHKNTAVVAASLGVAIVLTLLVLGGAKTMQEMPSTAISPMQAHVLAPSTETGITAMTTAYAQKTDDEKAFHVILTTNPKVSAAVVQNVAQAKTQQVAPDWEKIIAGFDVKAKKYYNNMHYSSNHYNYTQKELKMLAVVIYLEARNQPYACQVAVGNVVMNRVLSSGYPGSTIASVVTRRNQFCYSSSVKPNAECLRVAGDVLKYEVWTVPQNTYFFRATKKKGNWGSHKFVVKLGNTSFYNGKYAGRARISSVPPRLYARVFKWPQYGCKPAARVRKLQVMLKSLGYKTGSDGYFGIDTRNALAAFQKSARIKADGVAGPYTIKALIKKYGVEKYMKL
jgi:spore germination cell wall hydrolase CwlJ-like protein